MKITPILLLAVSASMVFNSCRKGEDDPFLSLRSRKARVAGEWTVTSASGRSDFQNSQANLPYGWEFDGTNYTVTDVNGTETFQSQRKYTFKKDGTYTYEFQDTEAYASRAYTEQGNWDFHSSVGDLKNKEQIQLYVTYANLRITDTSQTLTYLDTYSGTDMPSMIYELKELRNKKMVMVNTSVTHNNQSSFHLDESSTWILEQK